MELSIRPYRPGEEYYVADLHRRLYSEEYSWGPKFTDYAEKIALVFAKKEPSHREELLIAEGGDGPIGCFPILALNDGPFFTLLAPFITSWWAKRFGRPKFPKAGQTFKG